MKTYSLNGKTKNLLFDIDLTLYRHQAYYDSQTNNQILILSQKWNRPVEDLKSEIQTWDQEYRESHEGKKTSFGNILHGLYGVTIQESAVLRNQALKPEDYLVVDPKLRETLVILKKTMNIWALTNNAKDIGLKTLRVLGVEDLFPGVTGLEDSGYSKPRPEPFLRALKMAGFRPEETLSIGDRFDVDIAPSLDLGMGGILVESMEDVYNLGTVLLA